MTKLFLGLGFLVLVALILVVVPFIPYSQKYISETQTSEKIMAGVAWPVDGRFVLGVPWPHGNLYFSGTSWPRDTRFVSGVSWPEHQLHFAGVGWPRDARFVLGIAWPIDGRYFI